MRTIARSTTSALALDRARRLASERPAATLPCPACAASLKGANLERHIGSKHPAAERTAAVDWGFDELTLVGVDRRIRRSFGVLVVLWLALLVALVVTLDGPITADDGGEAGIADIAGDHSMWVLVAGLLLFAVIASLMRVNAFRARLSVRDGEIHLRYRLGTGAIGVALPAAIETGTLFVRRNVNGVAGPDGDATYERKAGAYLRIGSGHRAITVGCPHTTGLRKHWAGMSSGRRRKWWDVNLAAPAFVELQYALAETGTITPPVVDVSEGRSLPTTQ